MDRFVESFDMIIDEEDSGTYMEKAYFTDRFLSRTAAKDFLEDTIEWYLRENPNHKIIEYRLVLIGGIYSAGVTFGTGQYEMEI